MEIKEIIELMKAVSENSLTSFELEQGDMKITMKREKKLVRPEVITVSGAQPAVGMLSGSLSGVGLSVPGQNGSTQAVLAADGAADGYADAGALGKYAGGNSGYAGNSGAAEAENGMAGKLHQMADTAVPDKVVTCPLVGTFYSSPAPDAEDFVKVGDTVKKGQVIGIVEAMKLMNEIECEYDGVVEAILVKNEEVVEYGQPLLRIR